MKESRFPFVIYLVHNNYCFVMILPAFRRLVYLLQNEIIGTIGWARTIKGCRLHELDPQSGHTEDFEKSTVPATFPSSRSA